MVLAVRAEGAFSSGGSSLARMSSLGRVAECENLLRGNGIGWRRARKIRRNVHGEIASMCFAYHRLPNDLHSYHK